MDKADRPSLGYDDFVKHRFSGITPDYFAKYGINKKDLDRYSLSKTELTKLKELNVEQHFLVIITNGYHKKIFIIP